MPNQFLQIQDLSISFDKSAVIKDMNFNIQKGSLTTFLGPSGSGKTTVLRAIAGLNTQIGGKILLDGQDIHNVAANKRNIGMVFQSYALFPNLTVFENIAYGLKVRKLPKAEIREAVQAMLATVALSDKADAYPADLSGGQKQRVAIARAMVLKPKLLLLDEPLSALDAKIRVNLREQIRLYQQKFGITMIFVTHDQAEAMAISDDIVIINDGKVQQQGAPIEIYNNPANHFIANFIGNSNILSGDQLLQSGLSNLDANDIDTDTSYIIRPEVFNIGKEYPSDYHIPGQVVSSSVLGDRIEYDVSVNDQLSFKVESLNHNNQLLAGSWIDLAINQCDIKQVGVN
ncbi:ABC transporter ATP-binding protein [Apilactobacillus apinorum]|uniref:ABC transporter ATP-binding protein n=1 Tax=Apilactobacillus apinorum TaxID=1218495 RepID=UPI0006B5D1B8|nr:ABC transporter ATP-binding protein [Apilactobacillus apinorum]KOY69838.1 ABC transporter ATP-binding protein [Apilactobacillus apinorum]CAI2612539.1 ABC transporter ATP-binding protein [Apilactobacillus apinorum]